MTQDSVWLAYQLNRPDKGDGIIIAFRRKDCMAESAEVKLRGLDPASNYELVNDGSDRMVKTGSELMQKFLLTLPDKPGSLLIKYRKLL